MGSVINCDYCETVSLLEKILAFVLMLKMFPDSCLYLVQDSIVSIATGYGLDD
jgi:hypothetical protein